MGLKLFVEKQEYASSTVTAVWVPLKALGHKGKISGWHSWEQFDAALRRRGLVVGGSYGPLSGKVFRIGHMGSQADMDLLEKAMDIIQRVLETESPAPSSS